MAWSKVVFIAIVAAALYYLVGADKGVSEQDIANAQNEKKQSEALLIKTKAAMADLKKFRAQIDEMNAQFSQMTTYMTASPTFSDFVVALQKIAGQSGAVVRKINPSNKIDHVDFYETTQVSIEIEGRYHQLLSFLSDLSKMRRLITIAEVSLTQAGGGNMKNGPINFKANLVAYRYAQPTPTPDPNQPVIPGAAQNAH